MFDTTLNPACPKENSKQSSDRYNKATKRKLWFCKKDVCYAVCSDFLKFLLEKNLHGVNYILGDFCDYVGFEDFNTSETEFESENYIKLFDKHIYSHCFQCQKILLWYFRSEMNEINDRFYVLNKNEICNCMMSLLLWQIPFVY